MGLDIFGELLKSLVQFVLLGLDPDGLYELRRDGMPHRPEDVPHELGSRVLCEILYKFFHEHLADVGPFTKHHFDYDVNKPEISYI